MVYNLMSTDLTRHERKVGHTFAVKRAVRIKTFLQEFCGERRSAGFHFLVRNSFYENA